MKFTPKIRIDSGTVEGYGGPGYSWVRVSYENILLDEARLGSERDLGRKEAELTARWEREWDKLAFSAAIEGKPQASRRCDHCGGDTLDGQISCLNKTFCRPCDKAGIIENYKTSHEEERRRAADERESKRADEQRERHEAYQVRLADIRSGFHWRDNWFFGRMPDGSVRVARITADRVTEIVIPAPEWASIVCSVSSEHETGERWNAAQDFHGRPAVSPAPAPLSDTHQPPEGIENV